MYCMLSSSQPLIRTFVSFNVSHSFEKWLEFWFSRSLFKGESFSFVRGLWLLDLINRKTFLWIFFGSPLHLVFLDGDWKVFCFLAFEKLVWDLYSFSRWLSCLQEGDFNLGIFAGGPQLAWTGFICNRGFSLASLWSMITSCYFSIDLVFFSWHSKSDIVDVCLCRREGALGHLEQNVGLRNHRSSQIDRDSRDHHLQGIYKDFQVRSAG